MSQGQTQMTVFQKNYSTIKGLLEKNGKAIEAVATRHLSVERLTKLALTEFRRTPQLVMCEPMTVVASLIQAAQIGLEPGGVLGRCYLVPFRNKKRGNREECQLIVGYKGMIELAYRSGKVESVEGDVVFDGDLWKARKGLNRVLEHERKARMGARITHAYSIVRMRNGGVLYDYMTVEEIEAARQLSPAGDSPAWRDFYPQMAIKTVIRRQFKFCPASTEVATAVSFEELGEAGFSPDEVIDVDLVGGEPVAVPEPQGEPERQEPPPQLAPRVPHHRVDLSATPPTVSEVRSAPAPVPKRKSSLDRHLGNEPRSMTIRMANGERFTPPDDEDPSGGTIQ